MVRVKSLRAWGVQHQLNEYDSLSDHPKLHWIPNVSSGSALAWFQKSNKKYCCRHALWQLTQVNLEIIANLLPLIDFLNTHFSYIPAFERLLYVGPAALWYGQLLPPYILLVGRFHLPRPCRTTALLIDVHGDQRMEAVGFSYMGLSLLLSWSSSSRMHSFYSYHPLQKTTRHGFWRH